MTRPIVSVVIPTYNYAEFLPKAIESVLGQDDIQVIIVDDGSTDNTKEIVRTFGPGIEYIQQTSQGPSAARNRGIAASKGEFVAFLDADDYWLPGKLDQQVDLLNSRPDIAGCHTAFVVSVQSKNKKQRVGCYWNQSGYHPSFRELLRDNCVNMSTMVIRREVFSRIGVFDETLRTSEDWNFWLRVVLGGCRLYYLREPLVATRHHQTNSHVRIRPETQRRSAEAMLRSLWASNRDIIPEVFLRNLSSLLHYHDARISFERGENAGFWSHFGASVLLSPRLGAELFGGAILRRWRGWLASRRIAG